MTALRRFLSLLLLLVLVAVRAQTPPPPATVRVVSQTVGTDELLLALAEPQQIAALSQLARDPDFSAVAAEAQRYPMLAPSGAAESVLKYQPTLVLCTDYSRVELVTQLRRSGVRVLIFDHYLTLEDVYTNLRLLARELGAKERADRLVAECQARVAALQTRLKGLRPVRVLAPSTYGYIPGGKSTFQDLCDHAGAENLATTLGHLTGHAPQPSEQMVAWPVEYVVVGGHDVNAALAPFRLLLPYQYMPAVQAGRAVLLPPYLLSCVSHHRIEGYEIMAGALHPAAFQ
ncbi:MAG: ABC transporter substrate-binding protein [Opitutaceae bacterium]|nr:ABC transporter substrate-binding protein [Opitutaceae bacterium]